jgi:5-methyltetrahydrofolate--homocysteine methyltransferase
MVRRTRAEYGDLAERHAAERADDARAPLKMARANRLEVDWSGYEPPRPSHLGVRTLDGLDLGDLARYIDWTPFFHTWEIRGSYPTIFEDSERGEAARQLFDDAQAK